MSSWYFWFGSADYMANDGVSMERDHFGAALFSQRWKVTESLLLYLFHSPLSLITQELSPPTLLAIPCVFNTLLPSVFIKAIYKIYASLPKIQSSSTNYSQYMRKVPLSIAKVPLWHSKPSHSSFTRTWLKHTLRLCLDTSGTDEDMGTKSMVESKPDVLPQFLCSCTYTWHHASPKSFFPQAKNTSG